jgi:ABC-type phosphate transport system substrate-binding protein
MKNILITALLWSAISLVSIQNAVGGEGVAIIVNASNTQQLSEQEVKNIYADIVTQWDNGNKITVFNLYVDDEARETFSQKVFGESAHKQALAESNRKITNTIKNPSKTKSARLVAKLVAKDPNAIGYIPLSMARQATNVRIVLQID